MKTTTTRAARAATAAVLVGAIVGAGAPGASSSTTAATSTAAGVTVTITREGRGLHRISGPDRIATAIEASKRTTNVTGAVVLASAENYVDAIAGGVLAGQFGAALLLTDPDHLRDDVAAEIDRKGRTPMFHPPNGDLPGVYIMGGEKAVSAEVAHQVEALGKRGTSVERYAGADRYATAVSVANVPYNIFSSVSSPIYLASGTNFPDGLAVTPLANIDAGVVLLTDGATMPAATKDFLDAHDPGRARTIAVGGAAAAAEPRADSIVGTDRYDTAAKVAARLIGRDDTRILVVGLATGESWPDALAASAMLADPFAPGVLLLTKGDDLGAAGPAADALIAEFPRIDRGLVFGGTKAVPVEVFNDFATRFEPVPLTSTAGQEAHAIP